MSPETIGVVAGIIGALAGIVGIFIRRIAYVDRSRHRTRQRADSIVNDWVEGDLIVTDPATRSALREALGAASLAELEQRLEALLRSELDDGPPAR